MAPRVGARAARAHPTLTIDELQRGNGRRTPVDGVRGGWERGTAGVAGCEAGNGTCGARKTVDKIAFLGISPRLGRLNAPHVLRLPTLFAVY